MVINMFNAKKLGEQIAFMRQKNNYTQEKLAEKLGISSQAISKWENGNAIPGVPFLYKLSEIFNCSTDSILSFPSKFLHDSNFNYEFIVQPRVPVADYSGSQWPKSIALGSLFTALKLFYGLEKRRDHQNRQMNDDEEYILQSAITNICFGYSYAPDKWIRDSFLIYGLDYETYTQANVSQEEFIALAREQIENGSPVIIVPKEYRDIIFAVGYSDQGRVLKGLAFIDGDDEKNSNINWNSLKQFAGWYKEQCDIIIVKPSNITISVAQACTNALHSGIRLLLNTEHSGKNKMRGYGLVIYDNWIDLLKKENENNEDQIKCVFPHAFIHYENKLRTKQFFELCINTITDIDKECMSLAVKHYDEIISFAADIATIAHQRNSLPKEALKEKRNHIIERLRRSRELEEYALSYIQKSLVNIKEEN